MNKLSTAVICLLLCKAAFAQSGTVSTTFEPTVIPIDSHFSFSVAAAGSFNLTRNNWVSAQFGYSESPAATRTGLLGVGRNLVEFLPGLTLVGTVQAGRSFSREGDRFLVVYGTGVATDLGDGYSVTYGVHINKQEGTRLYPSLFVSLSKSW